MTDQIFCCTEDLEVYTDPEEEPAIISFLRWAGLSRLLGGNGIVTPLFDAIACAIGLSG